MAPTKLSLTCRPAEGLYTSEVAAACGRPLRTFLPVGYEPNYPYPLLVFLHGQGGNEDQAIQYAPRLSRRNYISIALRGPHLTTPRPNGQPGYGWGPEAQGDPQVEEYVLRAIEQTRREYHVHSERIYLIGLREGSMTAYRLGLLHPEWFAGVVALNGTLPRRGGPLLRLPEARRLRVFLGHGIANPILPLTLARQDFRLFYTAGLPVSFQTYPTTHRVHAEMLRDVNRWVQGHIAEENEMLSY